MDGCIMINSFEHEMPFRYNFSRKLVDYTSSGLPVLMWPPPIVEHFRGLLKRLIWQLYQNLLDLLEELILQFSDSYKRTELSNHITHLSELQSSYDLNYRKFLKNIRDAYWIKTLFISN